MRNFIVYPLFIACVLIPSSLLAGSQDFSVMNYNLHGIPCMRPGGYTKLLKLFKVDRCPDNTYYSQTIDERLKELEKILWQMDANRELPDVLLLQEAFLGSLFLIDDRAVVSLIKNSPYKFYSLGPKPKIPNNIFGLLSLLFNKRDGMVNSGLVILSQHPISKKDSVAFNSCSGSDCFANKGVAYAQIQVKGLPYPVDIFNTHMDAGRNSDPIRVKQNNVTAEFSMKNENSPWTIFGGDFNFRNNNNYVSFNDFLEKTQTQHSGLRCLKDSLCLAAQGTKKQWLQGSLLDHQFIATMDTEVKIQPKFIEYWHLYFNNKPLSDHYYMVVDYLLEW